MKQEAIARLRTAAAAERFAPVPENIPCGDMPGDSVCIGPEHIRKCDILFPALAEKLIPILERGGKAVVSVCGGSGVGKSETASLLAYRLRDCGIGCYVMSGDNYPRRIPFYNDAERVRVFRCGGIRALTDEEFCKPEIMDALRAMQDAETDSDPARAADCEWLRRYQAAGRTALAGYLGTPNEQDFEEVNGILEAFHRGDSALFLKRMGRRETELWYERVDVSDTDVLILEWTHGNNGNLTGLDLPVLLNSTPAETLEHRRKRNRDGKTDSPFTTMVLEIEQRLLDSRAHKAALILSKQGALLSYEEYCAMMRPEVAK